jgi:Holliday junction DNA helicase RuvA
LGILSGLSAEEFHRCVEHQDTARLVKLPGVGKKTAERLIIELRDRLPSPAFIELPGAGRLPSPAASALDDATAALVALGFKPQDAATLIRKVDAEGKTSEEIIRLALQQSAR